LHLLAFSSILLYCIYLPSPSTSPSTSMSLLLNLVIHSSLHIHWSILHHPSPQQNYQSFSIHLNNSKYQFDFSDNNIPPPMFKPINKIVQWFYPNILEDHCPQGWTALSLYLWAGIIPIKGSKISIISCTKWPTAWSNTYKAGWLHNKHLPQHLLCSHKFLIMFCNLSYQNGGMNQKMSMAAQLWLLSA
jgi:hypothetical protein